MPTQKSFKSDVISTTAGDLEIIFLGHGSLLLNFDKKNIYIDPYSQVADYSKLPKANLVLITHEHGDHLDIQALASIREEQTAVVLTKTCSQQVTGGMVMKNGDTQTIGGIHIEAVPAYNIIHKRSNGEPFHPQGIGNGYVMTFGDKRVYIAGDTEIIPDMDKLNDIHCAFLPMNLPYTMTPEMVADAAKAFRPHILYPYHYGSTETSQLEELLKDEKAIEVRIRQMA